jgi:hypothetical protein
MTCPRPPTLTLKVRLAQVEQQHAEEAAIVGINHSCAHINAMLARWYGRNA